METRLYGPIALIVTKLAKDVHVTISDFCLIPKRSFHMKQFINNFELMGMH